MTLEPMHGVLVVDKPEGPTSHDVVSRARRALAVRQIGHTGTLDPMATGVLPLVVGHATRLTQFLVGHDKSYDAVVRLGVATDTWDRTGQVLSQADPLAPPESWWPSDAAIAEALDGLMGTQDQVPPPFSAKKIGGVRAYALARQGQEVAVRPARVTLHAAEVLEMTPPQLHLRITCSAGYYVRALAQALGERLGCGGCLDALRRTRSGAFGLNQAVPLALLQETPDQARSRLLPLESLLPDFPAARLNEEGLRRALNGNDIGPSAIVGPPVGLGPFRLVSPDGRLVAIAKPGREPGLLHPAVVLK